MVERSVRPLETRTDHPDLGMPLEDGDDGVERPGGHGGIRVEREEVGSVPTPRSEIGSRSEAEVAGRCDQVDLGILARRSAPACRPRTRRRRRPPSSGRRADARSASRGIRAAAPAIGRRRSRRRVRRRRSSLTPGIRRDADVTRKEAVRTSATGGVGRDRPPPEQRVGVEEFPVQGLVMPPEPARTAAEQPGQPGDAAVGREQPAQHTALGGSHAVPAAQPQHLAEEQLLVPVVVVDDARAARGVA